MYRVHLMDGRVIDVSAKDRAGALEWLARSEGGCLEFVGIEDIGTADYWTLAPFGERWGLKNQYAATES